MRRLLCCFFLVGIFTPLLVSAQIILQSLEEVSVREQAGYNAAMRWSAIHNFPASIYLPNGSVLGIIRMEGPYPVYFTTHNDAAARITQTSRLHAGISGNQFQGSTMEMGIWDEGAVYETHQELDGRIFIQDNDNISNHATHVAGTLVAAGMQPEARGMAPNAQLQSFNWNFHASEMGAAANTGLLLSNHSYGRVGGWHAVSNGGTKTWYWFGNPDISQTEDFSFGFYDRDAFLFDNVTYFNPYYLPIVSAGNERDDKGPASGGYKALDGSGRWLDFDIETRPVEADGGADGYDSITSMALAKNALTVGSVGATAPNEFNLSAFSSTGPTDDGRIKPDLMGIGEGVLSSTAAGPAAYGRSSGTSMATPNVAGSLLLLQEMAITLHGQPLRAATLKALALHTAKDLGAPGPDYQHGWGLLNTAAAAEHLDAAFRREGRLQEQAISSAQVWEEELVKQSSGPLRITLSWTDPPGPTPESRGTYVLNDRTPMLTNDLDVVLEHKASEHLYYPFVLDPETPQLPAQQGDNLVDPIEQIFT
ncbi:MAG: S8 family serine peptidase, partial [Bacteroidota bacterium]